MKSRNPIGRPLGKYCRRGHLMAETRKRTPCGTVYCAACKKAQRGVAVKFAEYTRQMELLLRDGLSTTYGKHREWQMRVFRFFDSLEEGKSVVA